MPAPRRGPRNTQIKNDIRVMQPKVAISAAMQPKFPSCGYLFLQLCSKTYMACMSIGKRKGKPLAAFRPAESGRFRTWLARAKLNLWIPRCMSASPPGDATSTPIPA
jgi:hypothetical protein